MAKKAIYKSLYFQVIVAIIIGVILGHFYPETGAAMKPLGDGFIKLIKMIIAPIIFCTVVVGIDTSGSIDDHSLSVFVKAVNDIAEGCRPEAVYLVYCDSRVQRVDRYTADDFPLKVRPKGGGGTDLREVFAFVDKEGLAPDCLLLFTDCCTPWPEAVLWPTLVCSTSSASAPANLADTVHFPDNDS